MPRTEDSSRVETIRRRARTIPPRVFGLVLVTALIAPLLLLAAAVDAFRLLLGVPPTAARLVLFLWAYLAAEVVGLIALGALWFGALGGLRRDWLAERTWVLQQRWAGALIGAVRAIFGVRFEVEGAGAVSPGPVLVLIRHASIVDNLLPSDLVARPHGIRLRYVLKRELLADPCLDVAGKRLRNYFVRRDTGEAVELERIRDLAAGMGRDEGVLIYPEGTRFTAERRERAIARIANRDPGLAASAERLRYLLPPRPGGVRALLEGAPDADVVVIAHHGFDGLRTISDIWRGGLVRLGVRVRVTRIPRSQVPTARADQTAWLYGVWGEIDEWLASQRATAGVSA